MAIQVVNTSSQLSGKTIATLEATETISGVKTFTGNPKIATIVGTASGSTALNVTGNLVITGGLTTDGQIAFPATQNPSAGANVLDDYEEGVWTPVLGSTGGGSATQSASGSYVKIGRTTFVAGRITLTSKGTLAAGTLTVTGFPFPNDVWYCAFAVSHIFGMSTSISSIAVLIAASSSQGDVRFLPAAGATAMSVATVADIGNSFDIIFSGTYIASA